MFQNSAESLTQGIDLEFKNRFELGTSGKLTTGVTFTHLLKQRVIDSQGVTHDYAGTHGDCNITNCMGSPRDRISFATTWELGVWRLGANINYRGPMSYKTEESDTDCNQHARQYSDATTAAATARLRLILPTPNAAAMFLRPATAAKPIRQVVSISSVTSKPRITIMPAYSDGW